MRVAFDPSSTRGHQTGIGIYTENLVRALRRYAPEVEIVELDDATGADQRTDRRVLREQLTIPRLAGAARAEILHLTGFAVPWRAPCPVVLNAHDLIGVLFRQNFPPVSRFYWSRYLPFTLRRAARLIVLSEHTRKDVERMARIPGDRIRVIPPGRDEGFRPISDEEQLAATRARYDLPAEFILFVSTLEPRKGVDTLIDAFGRVAGEIPHSLVVVGKRGWYWEQFHAQALRLGLENRVRFIEHVPPEELPLVYNLAQAFVFPSRYEGFGLTPLEAMSCGTPVISSDASSLPEVIGDAGLLIPPDDTAGFASAIKGLLTDSAQRADLRMRGLAQARKFSWEHASQQTVELYRSIIPYAHQR